MSSLLAMAALIEVSGVKPCAYDAFVATVVNTLTPTQSTISNAYKTAVMTLARLVAAFVVLVIVIAVIVLVSLSSTTINLACAITIVVVAVVLSVVMWYAITWLLRNEIDALAPKVQKDTSDAALYAFNSVVRDAFFLTLCK